MNRWPRRARPGLPSVLLAGALVAVTACGDACSDLRERLGGLLDDEATAVVAPAARGDAGPEAASRRVTAHPALRRVALECRLAVMLPLRAGVARYRASVERGGLTDGHLVAVPPELAVEIETCRRGAAEVADPPRDAELRSAWQAFLDAVEALQPLLGEVSTYYRGLRYMDDAMQQAVPLHQRLEQAYPTLERADRRLAELLWQAQVAALEERRDATRGDPARQLHRLAAQTVLAAIALLGAVEQPALHTDKKRLAQLAGWRAGLDAYLRDNPLQAPAQVPDPASLPRLQAAAARVEQAGLRAVGDGAARGGGRPAVDALERAVLELALADAELR